MQSEIVAVTDRRLFVLAHPEARSRALACVAEAPEGYRVSVEPPRRDLAINAALHAQWEAGHSAGYLDAS